MTVVEQQVLNSELTAYFTQYIRDLEPEGITVSVGGEIGEVGEENSTEEELRAYLESYQADLMKLSPKLVGLSKISVLTGTSHGGVVLPDGSIKDVAVDFDLLQTAWQGGAGKLSDSVEPCSMELPHCQKLPSVNSPSMKPSKFTWQPTSRTSFMKSCQLTSEERFMPIWTRITCNDRKAGPD